MKKRIRDYIKQFFLIDDTPHKVAGGAALGVFLGITPGEGVLATLFFAYILRLNRLAALTGVLSVNMWTTVVALPVAAAIGGFVFRIDPQALSKDFHNSINMGWQHLFSWSILSETAIPLIVGYVSIAGAFAAVVYFGLLFFLIKKKKLSAEKHILTKDKLEI